jgi:hypothetical protein
MNGLRSSAFQIHCGLRSACGVPQEQEGAPSPFSPLAFLVVAKALSHPDLKGIDIGIVNQHKSTRAQRFLKSARARQRLARGKGKGQARARKEGGKGKGKKKGRGKGKRTPAMSAYPAHSTQPITTQHTNHEETTQHAYVVCSREMTHTQPAPTTRRRGGSPAHAACTAPAAAAACTAAKHNDTPTLPQRNHT